MSESGGIVVTWQVILGAVSFMAVTGPALLYVGSLSGRISTLETWRKEREPLLIRFLAWEGTQAARWEELQGHFRDLSAAQAGLATRMDKMSGEIANIAGRISQCMGQNGDRDQ